MILMPPRRRNSRDLNLLRDIVLNYFDCKILQRCCMLGITKEKMYCVILKLLRHLYSKHYATCLRN